MGSHLNAHAYQQVCSTREAADILGVSLRTVQLWVDSGILDAWKTAGGHRRVSRASIEALQKGRLSVHSDTMHVGGDGEFFLANQPIFGGNGRIFGYELLYRDRGQTTANFADPIRATAQVIRVAFGELGYLGAIGDALCFINVTEDVLHEDTLMALEPERIVLELPASTPPTERLLERCVFLKRAGFQLLLENYHPGRSSERLLSVADFVKLDLRDGLDFDARQYPNIFGQVKLVGGKLETEEAYEAARSFGCNYFQGYFFAHPKIDRGRQISPQRAALLDLLRLMLTADVSNAEIEKRLKLEPALCLNLLRLVNSAAAGIPRRVDTLREVLLLLGRQNLCRWIQLLLYADDEQFSGLPNPLMQLAAFRGRFLEHLVTILPGCIGLKDKAFMIGLLSYLEALLRVPLATILRHLQLTDEVHDALLHREGILGKLLALAEALDTQNFESATAIAGQLELDWSSMHRGMVESLGWSNALNRLN
ncbi:hypothetical protein B9N43_03145 [Denitratisoma sp. DHT3]|uniref:helix-turn-helix domain-containing protein n=1 Tax=Denitratisoma sp. DHT3 TaxID=1981880 RepID=UPI001198C965|nr:helix-turn-helix domain-containing protein [Denitratisoma sp. DHT3]QDX80347.1 hypothetical protein B9N43_03145 [Denitratisoma sp. DHT3]